VQISDSLVNLVGKGVKIIIDFYVSRVIDAEISIMICYNIPLLSFNIVKDKLIFQTDDTFKCKEQLLIDTYRGYFSYISDQ
jgi:hypothetical protein